MGPWVLTVCAVVKGKERTEQAGILPQSSQEESSNKDRERWEEFSLSTLQKGNSSVLYSVEIMGC